VTSKINPTIASTVRENSENKLHEEAIENQAPEFRHADKELGDAADERFVLDENENVIDRLNPVRCYTYCYYYGDAHPNQFRLRESILRGRLDQLVSDLIPNRQPEVTDGPGQTQPFNHEQSAVSNVLFAAIRASHLNALEPTKADQDMLKEPSRANASSLKDISSISLFRDDVGRLLRELYGVFDSEALDSVLLAVLQIAVSFTRYFREDLWQEHHHAEDWDYVWGAGPPDGCSISSRDYDTGLVGLENLRTRVRDVRKNPSGYCKYTVEFAKRIEEVVTLEDDPNLIAERNREHAQLIRNIEANGYKVLVREDNDGVYYSIL
jgi:hypothetical protein